MGRKINSTASATWGFQQSAEEIMANPMLRRKSSQTQATMT
jgi:hypothetical protein